MCIEIKRARREGRRLLGVKRSRVRRYRGGGKSRSKSRSKERKRREEIKKIDDVYINSIISGLAVLGLDEDCAWKGPSRATRALSAVVTVARMLVLYRAKLMREAAIKEMREEQGFSRAEASKKAPTHFQLA
ncbi:hypothetical protein NA57DRAFT_62543 [Rhizodiscina lignyota]|uniref:Uncharacterized protein n=1 Tax=Rhizodiscina lignyota TaxID=1504668 RepID=A0A9P4I5A9_9PEZI|nr:hypothetical protein NA57DRAFT_62543 [Rhizodiscina lignyota]